MADLRNRNDARVEGLMRANEAIRKLLPTRGPWVDAFAGVLEAGGFLMMRPLDGLCGAYLPNRGGTPGVLVNSKHPLSLQRFTVAHELGHLWMNHGSSLDGQDVLEHKLDDKDQPLIEIAANAFAAHFLMPRRMVLERIDQLGLARKQLADPRIVYLLALWFGVSYRAMAFQLATLKHLSRTQSHDLVKVPPKVVKESLMAGSELENPWSDVLEVDESARGQVIALRVGDYLSLSLESHAAGGFLWQQSPASSSALGLHPRETVDEHEGANHIVGAASPTHFLVALKEPGIHELALEERRPFSESAAPADVFNMTVVSVAKPEIGMGRALLPTQAA